MYKIKTLGSRGPLYQIDRIDYALRELGHKLVLDKKLVCENPDFIYVNDSGHAKEGLELKKRFPKSKLILNTLDVPFHAQDISYLIGKMCSELITADAVTTISHTVKGHMEKVFPFLQNNKIRVIYQPINDVKPLNLQRNDNLLVVGRQGDANKRFLISLELASILDRVIHVIGVENPTNLLPPNMKVYAKYIKYIGELSVENLNKEYSSCAALLTLSRIEGLNLPLIEGLCCKTPIVCCEDMDTALEFCPKEFISRNSLYDLSEKFQYVISGAESVAKTLNEYSDKYLKQFDKLRIAQNIIEVFEGIKK